MIPALALMLLLPPAQSSDGGGETSHARMLSELGVLAERSAVEDPYVGLGAKPAVEAQLDELAPHRLKRRWMLLRELGFHELRLGNVDAAVERYRAAVELHGQLGGQLRPEERDQALFDLALAWLRWGETQNCVARHSSRSCILPIGGDGVHVEQEGSRNAMAILLDLLERGPGDVSSMWLLNVAAMTVGEWPDAVPEAWRVPADAFTGGPPFPRFVDVAPELGLATFNLSGGSVVEDIDGDGVLDVLTSTWDPAGQLRYFRGEGGGRFVERTEEANLTGIFGGLNLMQADYDGDGDVDVLVLRGAWLGAAGAIPNSLLRNDAGVFTDVTFDAGLGDVHRPTQAAAWADYDNDGDLDVYVGNEAGPGSPAPSQLFRNEGDGTFVDVAGEMRVAKVGYAKGVTWGDYDGDRWPDLFVSNQGGPNHLFRNRKGAKFSNVAERLKLTRPRNSFASWWWDYDNDGRLDLFVASYVPTVAGVAAGYLGLPTAVEHPWLYQQAEDGVFRPVQKRVGVDRVTCVMGANFGDLDNDGWLDFYLGTGFPGFEGLMPNLMYWNREGKRFEDVTAAGGFGHVQKGHGVAFADLDEDGDTDLFVEMGGAFPGDAFGNALFRNPGFGTHWLTVRLVGVQSNSYGVGARIRCDVTEDGVARSIWRWVGSGGSFGCNPLAQTIGLGQAERVDRLEIWWPTSDTTQVFEDVEVDRRVRITEGRDRID